MVPLFFHLLRAIICGGKLMALVLEFACELGKVNERQFNDITVS